jgi:heme-degrading monooxygenase HmoA
MIAVIFEVIPHDDKKDAYLEVAAKMKAEVQNIDGFISVERFQSLMDPNKLVSLSYWRDEAALNEWRALQAHRKAQTMGRDIMFSDYRLRVASVMRDYGMTERDEAPADSVALHR